MSNIVFINLGNSTTIYPKTDIINDLKMIHGSVDAWPAKQAHAIYTTSAQRRCTLNFVCYIDWAPASSIYKNKTKKKRYVSHIKKK